MRILHTEASPGMGGQELRILREAMGMRERGHQIFFAVQGGSLLASKALSMGFEVIEVNFSKASFINTMLALFSYIRKEKIEIINTHSSLDAWIGGAAGKLANIPIIRTRHLSTPVRKGINSKILYNFLASKVITTCEHTKSMIQGQAKLSTDRVLSIPTGVDLKEIAADLDGAKKVRASLGVKPDDCLVGTLCVLRGWKGIFDLLHAAKICEEVPNLKWVVVGGGVSEEYFKRIWRELKLENKVFFTGHLDNPYPALAAMDIFVLLSHANEGVSQATLQAAACQKPLITTKVGGLPEVCVDGVTGFQVDAHSPAAVAEAVLKLQDNRDLRKMMGAQGKMLIETRFTFEKMLNDMENVYGQLKHGR